ncbi:MAG: DUF5719 family protein [Propionibacteriaceae bacterium]|jgi:hypothetical protein|nr:DUF5719 family protein [Propionibacteriaceae bacterium]
MPHTLDWRRLQPFAAVAVAVLAVAVLVTALLAPGRAVPDPLVAVAGDRTVACPVGDPVFGQTTVTGEGEELRWSALGGELGEAAARFSLTDPEQTVVVTGDQSMGVLSTAVQRGALVGAFCATPSATGWWDGVWVTDTQESALILTNVDDTSASVTLTVYSQIGPVSVKGLRQIPIDRYETRVVDLNTFFRDAGVTVDKPVAIELKADTGRVVSYLRSQGELGEDWRQSSVGPTTDLVIPGVPTVQGEGEGASRYLFITNHGDTATKVQVLGQGTGAAVPLAAGTSEEGGGITIQPQTTTFLDLSQALAGETIGIVLHSLAYREGADPQAITAALVVVGTDMGSVAAQPEMSGGMVIPAVKDASLVVTNPGEQAARVVLTPRDAEGVLGTPSETQVNPGTLSIPLGVEAGSVDVTVDGDGVRVVLIVPRIGDTAGLIVAPLGAGGALGLNVTINYDPTLG